MTRTPEEIKKGLECCITDNCKGCPYYPLYEVFGCKLARAKDALALIQQLQKDKADLLEERELNDYLRDRVKQLEAERNAAVADMAEIVGCPCGVCKHYLKDGRKEPCNSCRNIRRGEESHFEWRGVQKD